MFGCGDLFSFSNSHYHSSLSFSSFSLAIKEETTTQQYLESVLSKVEKKNMGMGRGGGGGVGALQGFCFSNKNLLPRVLMDEVGNFG